MTELPPDVEQRLFELSSEDFHALIARVRPPEDLAELVDPKTIAAEALRRHLASNTIESVAKEFNTSERDLNS